MAKANIVSYAWDGVAPHQPRAWAQGGHKAASQGRTRESWWACKLNRGQQCALAAKPARTPGCISKTTAGTVRSGIPSLCPALVRPHLGTGSSLGLPSTRKTQTSWSKASSRLECTIRKQRQRELGVFNRENRKSRGELITVFNYVKGD